jgi:hypothetical protein
MELKPFNLELALAGDPVVTRGGKKIKNISCKLFAETDEDYMQAESIMCYEDGRFHKDGRTSHHDLFMAPKKIKGWIAVSKESFSSGSSAHLTSSFYSNKELFEKYFSKEFYYYIETEIEV